jgi:hypothetical protein
MDIGIMGENGKCYIEASLTHCCPGDVRNLKMTVALNHYQAATIMSSFPNNMANFPNHNISEFPFNDSIRFLTYFVPSPWAASWPRL